MIVTTPRRLFPLLATALLASSLLPAIVSAQTTSGTTKPSPSRDEAADNPVLVLSPFEVTGEEDTGYVATETLAGTRIRTDLRDVGSAISVITKEFMRDIGATDSGTLLQYTTNAEVAGTRGTYTGAGNGVTIDESANLRAPAGAQRVRGLASADNTRDFFITDIPTDYFNVDRVDIQRGPNSILFGLGSPAGIVNTSLRSAEFRNKGSVEFRAGSYGSVRANVDFNKVLIKNVLSFRVAGLWDKEKFRQDYAFENDKRVYGVMRFEPKLFKNRPDFRTSLKVKFESGEIDANRPRSVTPNDNITAWWRPRAVSATNPFGGMGQAVVNNPYDAFRNDTPVAGDGRGQANNASPNYQPYLTDAVNQQQPLWTIDGHSNTLYAVQGGFVNTGARNNTGGFTGSAAGLLGKRQNGILFLVNSVPGSAIGLGLPNAQLGQYRNLSLQDATIFDFYNTLLDGPNKYEREAWDAMNVNLSQTGWGDRVGIELSYDRQKYNRSNAGLLGGTPALTLDVSKNLVDYWTNASADGITSTTNPNFGRPLVTSQSGGSGSSYESDREYLRASIFGEIRASDFLAKGSFLARLLGKHRFNGVAASEKFSNEGRGWVETANSQEWAGFWNGTNGLGSGIQDRPPVAAIYLGPSVLGSPTAAGINVPGITAPITLNDSGGIYIFNPEWQSSVAYNAPWSVPANLWRVFNGTPNPQTTANLTQASNPANYKGWSNYPNTLLRYNNGQDLRLLTRAQLSIRETTSYAGSWQAFMWNDAIIPTFGWRFDEVKGKQIQAQRNGGNRNIVNLAPDVYRLPDGYPANQIFKDHSTSGGVVVHLNKLFGDKDRLPINVSLSYNQSSNFQVTDTRRDIYGNPIGNPTGDTTDYGILLSTKDGKYSFRALQYKTNVYNGDSAINNPGGLGGFLVEGMRFRNVFLYKLGVYDWATREQWAGRNTWGLDTNVNGTTIGANQALTAVQGRALEDAAIRGWNEIQAWLTDKGFFQAWNFTPPDLSVLTDRTTYENAKGSKYGLDPAPQYAPNPAHVTPYVSSAPSGLTVTSDTHSKGLEMEFTANPTKNWRIAFNASKTEATRTNVGGPLLDELIAYLDSKLVNADGTVTPAGQLFRFGGTGNSLYATVYAPWRSNYVAMKLNEGTAAPEIRKWRYTIVTNYTFREGRLKGFGVGGSYRWQDKVGIGYPAVVSGTGASFDFTKPYYGPAEDAVDLWTSYERKLTDKINWRIQLNIRNAFAKDGLIPISVQPDGQTWAGVRVKPNREWFVTNTFSF